jgi:hypothetical protein
MKIEYQEIKFSLGDNVESAVKKLLKYDEPNKVAFGVFNGVVLFSDTVTLDGAYKEVTNMPYNDFKKLERELIEQAIKNREQE